MNEYILEEEENEKKMMRRPNNENWSSHSGPGPSSRSDDESRSDSSTSTSKGAPTVFHKQLFSELVTDACPAHVCLSSLFEQEWQQCDDA
jgi:hypothetical protein